MLLALLLAVHLAPAYVVDPAESSLKYTVIHKLHKVEATTNQVEGRAVARGESVLTEVRAQVASFRSGDSNRDEHMDEVMNIGTDPMVVLKGIVPVVSGELPQGPVRMNAQIELHGVKKAYQIPVTITSRPSRNGSGTLPVYATGMAAPPARSSMLKSRTAPVRRTDRLTTVPVT